MVEAVVTLVVPASNAEPTHTKVFRLEFETEEDFNNWLQRSVTCNQVNSERLVAE
jgi:hypothetical protein